MTEPTHPPHTPSDDTAPYTVAADEYVSSQSDDEDEDESGKTDSSGGGQKYKVFLDPVVDYADESDLSDEENAQNKLRKLDMASMGFLVAGASAFASENDLSRKTFMAKIGDTNKEITTRDIANPKLFHILDARAAERRLKYGLKTLDEIVTGAMGAAGAAIKFMVDAVSDHVQDKREERKASRLIQDFEDGKETYALDSDDYSVSKSSLETVDFPVQNDQGNELVMGERERIYENLSRRTQYDFDAGEITLAKAFTILADVMPSQEPVRTVRLDNIHFDIDDTPDAPGVDQELNPMGG